jgi:uncharacterized protein (TIGR02996 family)
MDTLDRALALWRARPSRGHAELVRRASRLVRRDDELLDVIREPAASDARMPVGRFAELARRSADPRIAEAALAMLETYESYDWGSLSADWKPLFQIFESGDATIVPRLRELADRERATARMASRLVPKLEALADALEARTVPADVDSPESLAVAMELEKLDARRRALEEGAVELFDAVWAAPDDDAPRFVLADFLNEHAEPRGEFIALQLARGKVAAAARKREKKLLARNKLAWIGAIAPLVQVQDARFERGFIVGCRLKPHVELEMKLGDHPAWSTIREYTVHPLDVGTNMHLPLARMLRAFGARMVDSLTRGID